MIHIHNGVLFSLKKEFLTHATTQMNLENIIVSEEARCKRADSMIPLP